MQQIDTHGWKKMIKRYEWQRNIRKEVNLDSSCLTQKEKDELMEMLYKYSNALG